MNLKFLATSVLTTAAIALGATISLQQPSQAQSVKFVCAVSSTTGLPTTFAVTPRGNVAVIRWYSDYFSGSGYTPERRCQEVAGRFQNLHNQGLLANITTGYVNGLPVVCAGSGGGCNSNNLLFTLKQGADASAAVQQLFDLRAGATSTPLYESSGDDDPSITIDMNNYLSNAPIDNSSSPSAPAATPGTSEPPSQPSTPSGGSVF